MLVEEGRKEGRDQWRILKSNRTASDLVSLFLACDARQETDLVCHADTTCLLPQSGLLCPGSWFDVCSSTLPSSPLSDSRPPFPSRPVAVQAHPSSSRVRPRFLEYRGLRVRRRIFKCAVLWASATSACADPQATSCMRSPVLLKHPSHRRHSVTLHRKLSGCMHVHTCGPQSLDL